MARAIYFARFRGAGAQKRARECTERSVKPATCLVINGRRAMGPSELKKDLSLVIEPDQQHVPLRYRCPAISISPARAPALVSQDAAVERAVDRLIADQDLSIDPEHQARQDSVQPLPFMLGPNTFALHRKFFYFRRPPAFSSGTVWSPGSS